MKIKKEKNWIFWNWQFILARFFFFFFFFFSFSFLLFPKTSWGATCNDIADGNWNSSSTWDCAIVPDSDDDVTIDSHTVTITVNQSAKSVTINGGTLNMGSYTLSVSGNWTWTSGTLDAGTSTLKLIGGDTTFTPGSVSYYNLHIERGNYGDLTISGTANITNNLIIDGYSTANILSGELNVYGDVSIIEGVGGSALLKIMGNNNQTLSSNDSLRGFSRIEVDKTGGVLNLEGTIVVVNWTLTNGTIDAGTSTIKFDSRDSYFTPGNAHYYNMEVVFVPWAELTITGTVILDNDLIINNVDDSSDLISGQIDVYGDILILGHGVGGSTLIRILGEKNQKIQSAGLGLGLIAIEINKSGGVLSLEGTLTVAGSWKHLAGDVNSGSSLIRFIGGNTTFTPGDDVKYYDIEINTTSNGYDRDFELLSNLNVINEIRVTRGNFLNTTGNYTITTKDFTQTGGTVNLGSGAMKVTGNFTRTGGTFTAGTSVVAFQGKNQTIDVTGNPTTFYKLYKLTNSADTLTITAGNTITIASGGVIRFWGKYEDVYSNSAILSIRSSSPGTQYNITLTGSAELEYTDWQDANFSTAVTAAASNDSGNNTNLTVTKEFISTIRASGGDYTTLSAWEAAVNCDLTAASTKVFSHSGITGTMPDNSSVTGATSGATATLVHATNSQILLKDISGTFQSGEQVQIDGSNYVTITDNGYGAIATAHPYNDWPGGLDDVLNVGGWTTDAQHYVKVYVLRSERGDGLPGTGFRIAKNYTSGSLFYINGLSYGKFFGIEIENTNTGSCAHYGDAFRIDGGINNLFDSVISRAHCSSLSRSFLINDSSYSNIFKNCLGIGSPGGGFGIAYDSGGGNKFYNSVSAFNGGNGFFWEYFSPYTQYGKIKLLNNVAFQNGGNDYSSSNSTEVFRTAYNNASSDTSAYGANSVHNIPGNCFIDSSNDNFHLTESNCSLKNAGADLSIDPDFPVIDDIDGDSMLGFVTWNIGADQHSDFSPTTLSPTDDNKSVATSTNLVINYPEAVTAHDGRYLYVKREDDNSTVFQIEATDTNYVLGDGTDEITINLPGDLEGGTKYYVVMDKGCFTNNTDQQNAAISDSTTWNFQTASAGWYDTSWTKRKKITIDHTQVEGNQTDFPVLLSLTDTDFKNHAQTDGDDFLITDTAGNKLAHEIEEYNSSTGELVLWFKAPYLYDTTNTHFYIYYGNPLADNQEDGENVWTNGYVMVQHMNDTTSSTITDSTSNNNDGTKYATDQPVETTGKIGKAQNFDGVDDYINTGGPSISGDTLTLSAWIKADLISVDQRIISKWGSSGSYCEYILSTDDSTNNKLTFAVNTENGNLVCDSDSSGIYNNTDWFHVTGVYNGSSFCKIYVNSVDRTSTPSGTGHGSISTSLGDLHIGNESEDDSKNFSGKIDQIQISNTARSAEWIKTEYNNQNAPGTFLALSGEESHGATAASPQSGGASDEGLIGYWSFDGPDVDWSSSTAEILDRSGNNNHGDAVGLNKNSVAVGKLGQALSFDGVDDYINASDVDISGDEITISGWVKIDSLSAPDAVAQAIASKGYIYGLEIMHSSGKLSCVFATTDKGWNWCSNTSNTALTPNTWYFVAVTKDSSGYKYYINGSYDGGGTDYYGNFLTNDDSLGIGRRSGATRTLKGQIDEVRIYNRALSAAEINQLYNMGKVQFKK